MIALRARHALEAVALVASAPAHSPVTISDVAQHIGMSMSYAENLLKMLKVGGILLSVRGPGGGYHMARAIAELNAWDIIQCVSTETDLQPQPESVTPGPTDPLERDYAALCLGFLRNYPLSRLVDEAALVAPKLDKPARHRGLRPMPKPQRPNAPASVFEWSTFMGNSMAA
ncbi:RrF2 family transcriptional regulator [Amphibiibacter pelophylacis]|uniref:Rrf2 family transcriptional regulator n=1 Tax=Amphibiibacter pelophylacis TaxID=1799477 RepID=A0ACC6P118_9BURK